MRELAAAPQAIYTLTVLSGNDRGAVYKLISGRITIGRDSENTIVLGDDPKVSRQHAVIVLDSTRAQISDTSERNKMIVNGQETKACELQSGAVIQLGETKLMFKNTAVLATTSAASNASPDVMQNNVLRPSFPNLKKAQGNRPLFYTILSAALLLVIWLGSQKHKSAGTTQMSSDAQIKSTIKTDQKIVNDIETERAKNGMNSRQYAEAERQFIEGFREYEKGQYDRSIEAFEACTTLFPNQQTELYRQCNVYLQLAQTRFQELIQFELNLGAKYKDQGQYRACIAAYRNVMFMVQAQNVPSDRKIFDLARAGHDACVALEDQDN